MATKEEILKKWLNQANEPLTLHFDTVGKLTEAMQEFCDQETKEVKQQLEYEIIQRQAAITDWDEMHNQLTEANALIEKMALKMKEASDYLYEVSYVNGKPKYLNSIGSQSKLHDSFLYLYNEYKTKQTTQEVKP